MGEAGMEACDDRGLPSESPTPPFSPPPSSPAPPPNKLPSESRYSVSAQVTIVGSVSDYGPAELASMECKMAATAKVSCSAVTVTMSPGSVILDFAIVTTDAAATYSVVQAAMLTKEDASAVLGVDVETVPSISQSEFSPPSSPPSSSDDGSDGLSVGASVAIAVGVIIGVGVLAGIVYLIKQKKQSTAFGTPVVKELSFPSQLPYGAEEEGLELEGASKV